MKPSYLTRTGHWNIFHPMDHVITLLYYCIQFCHVDDGKIFLRNARITDHPNTVPTPNNWFNINACIVQKTVISFFLVTVQHHKES